MKRILVTGAAGMIGANFVEYLSDKNVVVCGVDNLTGGSFVPKGSHVQFHKCDVESKEFVKIFNEFRPDIVYHMAAYAAEGLSPFIRKFNYTNNLISTTNVVNCCINQGVERLVFLSSMAVYGDKHEPPFHEDFQQAPIDPYGVAKYACEMDIQIGGDQHGLDWCIIRPHNVYGKYQNIWDSYRNVLGIWMYKHLKGEPISIFGDGTQQRAFSYVGDCMHPLWMAGTSDKASKEIINLGGTISRSIEEAADVLIEVMGGGKKVFLEGRHEVKRAFSTWQKSIDILEYGVETPETDFKEGLTDMWKYAQKYEKDGGKAYYGGGYGREWKEYEINKGIYEFWRK